MSHEVDCIRLKKRAPGLPRPPFPGTLGEKIFNQVSLEAWKQWLQHQTMLINEHQLALNDPAARQYLNQELEKYFFGEGSEKPAGYKPIE